MLYFVKKFAREGEQSYLNLGVGSLAELSNMVSSLPEWVPEVQERQRRMVEECIDRWVEVDHFEGSA